MLLGEPSPSLLRIQAMNMEKLAAKIIQLGEEQVAIKAKVERLEARDPQPTEQIDALKLQIERLATLQKLASERLEKKKTRKAEWDRKNAR